ncbi:MAG: peptidylprolyl isomerase [Halobacteriales archaeon]|nr:peptidylprolyl isomerase [Halobacteriales archaeon]
MSDEPEADVAAAEGADAEDEVDEPVDDAESEAPTEGLGEDDFVRLAYTIRTVEDGTLVDTTDPEVAEDEGVDTEEQTFEPRIIVIGGGHVFPAVEDDLKGKEVGDTGSVAVDAAEAFGEYDQEQVRTVSADRIPEDDRFPGAHVDIDGQHGHVETVIGGRARVDFNHPLAGEDVEYEYEVLEVVDDPVERAQGLLGMFIDVDLELSIETVEEEQAVYDDEGEEEGTETVELETLYIESVPQLAMNQQWLFSKQQIADQLIDQLDIDQVIVREVFDGSGGGMFGGMGGMGGLEDAIEDADLDEDVDTDELVEELEAETDLDADDLEIDETEE